MSLLVLEREIPLAFIPTGASARVDAHGPTACLCGFRHAPRTRWLIGSDHLSPAGAQVVLPERVVHVFS